MHPFSLLVGLGAVPLALIALAVLVYVSRIVVYIPNSKVGLVQKLWSPSGSVKQGFIALGSEAGYLPDVLRGGFHFFKPFQYRVTTHALVLIPQGQIGYVFARDGQDLPTGQTLARNLPEHDFQNVRAFLTNGGQKGPQRRILREGAYAINPAQFFVLTQDGTYGIAMTRQEQDMLAKMAALIRERDGFKALVIRDANDEIGVVTVHDGPSLPEGELIAPVVGNDGAAHSSFQDPEAFLAAGGYRGRQLQVLVEGTYYLNRLFATVELETKTIIEVGNVGVVVSYTGPRSADVSGEAYKHGELVDNGCRGVWKEPLRPGKYAFNPYAGKITIVPTVNFILKWEDAAIGSMRFDENLKEISLITKDAFEAYLPLSVVVHIDYRKAPLVVQRFGDIKHLVEQTLDPLVAAYFKNEAQTKTLIQLLQERSAIQDHASVDMREKFAAYNLELLEVLIGTPKGDPEDPSGGIESLLTQLRQRQIAREQVETYQLQEQAATQERSLRQAEATAAQQGDITRSELSITIRSNEGRAQKALAEEQAQTTVISAKARAEQLSLEGEGQAKSIRAVGEAEAAAIDSKVKAFGGPQYQVTSDVMKRFAEAVEKGGIALVPQVQVGADASAGGNVLQSLMTVLLSRNLQDPQEQSALALASPAAAKAATEVAGAQSSGAEAGSETLA